jgi:beta-glucanase (GH16 family)
MGIFRVLKLTVTWAALALLPSAALALNPVGIPPPAGFTWKLVLREEFSGTSINAKRWNTNWLGPVGAITPPVNSAEVAAYDPTQCKVSDGKLVLTAVRKRVKAYNGTSWEYASCLVNTYLKHEYVYGVFEARIRWPGTSAKAVPKNWGAFWINGKHRDWPDKGEIDIVENLSGGPARHYHFGRPDIDAGASCPVNSGRLLNSWHIYSVQWTATQARFYCDGVSAGVVKVKDANAKYIILNYGISHLHGGPVASGRSMQVDYVRVWQAVRAGTSRTRSR